MIIIIVDAPIPIPHTGISTDTGVESSTHTGKILADITTPIPVLGIGCDTAVEFSQGIFRASVESNSIMRYILLGIGERCKSKKGLCKKVVLVHR